MMPNRNMLQEIINSVALLVPLHHKVEKWVTAKLVEKNKRYGWQQPRKQ